ncbi:MAG: Lrp/AsnC family transcriptional regulator [gamma proteobacterium symbiont of Phacoides pectinatus]
MRLIRAIQGGLPLVPRPYAEIATRLGLDERQVIERITRLRGMGIIKRFGVVVRHHELGFRFNAMVVWDIPDHQVGRGGRCIGQYDFVTLCYRRPRRLPHWRYNLFSMIHGRDRGEVIANVRHVVEECSLQEISHELLFSRRRLKQRGARYDAPSDPLPAPAPWRDVCGG